MMSNGCTTFRMDKKLLILIKLFFCLFLILPQKALASDFQWLKVLKTEDGNIFYVDKKSINKKKDKVFFIKLHEYSDFNKYGEKSSIIHHEVDCTKTRIKYLKDFYYKLPMGKGEVSYFGNQHSEWIKAKQDTILSTLINYVCNY